MRWAWLTLPGCSATLPLEVTWTPPAEGVYLAFGLTVEAPEACVLTVELEAPDHRRTVRVPDPSAALWRRLTVFLRRCRAGRTNARGRAEVLRRCRHTVDLI